MSLEENKMIAQRLFEGINQGNPDILDEVAAPTFFSHAVPAGLPCTRDGYKQALGFLFTAFPDYHVVVEDLVAEDDQVVARLTVGGTHQGTFFGIAPTGKQVTWPAVDFFRLADGKLVEHWLVADIMALLQ
ncbi:MAG TPA: ester cyclase [Ktedonosporobacter sp.]|nr:ester cyclase [Ktedonosporobacter sp.]